MERVRSPSKVLANVRTWCVLSLRVRHTQHLDFAPVCGNSSKTETVEVSVKAGLAAFLGLVLTTSPVMAEGRVAEVFANICLAQFPSFQTIDMAAYQPFTRLVADDPALPPSVPLVVPTRKTSWMVGSPTEKSPDDFALLVSEGTVLQKPARGCAVLGKGGRFQEEPLLARFETNQFIGVMEPSLTPGYRIWLVSRSGQNAFFGISTADQFAPTGASVFLVVPDPSVTQPLADQLSREKN